MFEGCELSFKSGWYDRCYAVCKEALIMVLIAEGIAL